MKPSVFRYPALYWAVALGLSLSAAVPSRAAETQPSAALLRTAALKVLSPLPSAMPGSEGDTPIKIALGKRLFNEKRLSANQSQSCNSCHRLDEGRGGVDNEAFSLGAFGKRGGRNAPTVLNAGFHVAQFWDGRAASLADQAKGPVLNPVEMGMPNSAEVVARLTAVKDYPRQFSRAFPGEAAPITYDNIAKAIAAFERTLITRDRFDDFLRGKDGALTLPEQRGLSTFLQAGCTTCHNGPLLGGNSYQKLGLVAPYHNTKDNGRASVTKDEDDTMKFKVPSLRNIALTAPYFHDGFSSSLDHAVREMGRLQLGKDLSPAEVGDIVAFLRSLSDTTRAKKRFASN